MTPKRRQNFKIANPYYIVSIVMTFCNMTIPNSFCKQDITREMAAKLLGKETKLLLQLSLF